MQQTVSIRAQLCTIGPTFDLISAVVMNGIQCRSGDTVTKNCLSHCQCHSTNIAHRTLLLYYSCQKDERAKPWSFQIGNGLLDLREHWTAECLHVAAAAVVVVVVVVCFRDLTSCLVT